MWERSCVQKGYKRMAPARQMYVTVDGNEKSECWAMIVGSHTAVGDVELVDNPTDHFNVRITLCFTHDADATFDEANDAFVHGNAAKRSWDGFRRCCHLAERKASTWARLCLHGDPLSP